jgi:hypothetical protein
MESRESKCNADDARASFDVVLASYCECLITPFAKAVNYDDSDKVSPTRYPGSPTSHFICDVDLTIKRTLTTPELLAEWERLVDLELAEQPDIFHSKAQAKLTNRVVSLVARAAHKKGLDSLNYFRTVTKRAA